MKDFKLKILLLKNGLSKNLRNIIETAFEEEKKKKTLEKTLERSPLTLFPHGNSGEVSKELRKVMKGESPIFLSMRIAFKGVLNPLTTLSYS